MKIDSLREKTKVEYKDRFKDQGAEGYSKKSSSVLNTLPKNTLAQDSVSKQWFLFWQISVNQSRIKSRREIKAKSENKEIFKDPMEMQDKDYTEVEQGYKDYTLKQLIK